MNKMATCPICKRIVYGQRNELVSNTIKVGKFAAQIALMATKIVPGGYLVEKIADGAVGAINSDMFSFQCKCGNEWTKRYSEESEEDKVYIREEIEEKNEYIALINTVSRRNAKPGNSLAFLYTDIESLKQKVKSQYNITLPECFNEKTTVKEIVSYLERYRMDKL